MTRNINKAIAAAVIPHEADCSDPSNLFTVLDALDENMVNLLVYCTECGAARYVGTFEDGVEM